MSERTSRRRRAAASTNKEPARSSRTRARSRASAPATQSRGRARAKPSSSTVDDSLVKTGDDIFEEAERAAKQAERRSSSNNMFRFYVPQGEETEIIVLDEALNKGIGLYEHSIFDKANKRMDYYVCRKEAGDCEHCDNGDFSSYVVYITVLELKPFIAKRGTPDEKEIPWSKKLFPIKRTQLDKWKQLQHAAEKQGGTMRGMFLVMQRGTGDKSPRIGDPAILDNGQLFEMIPEEELDEEYGNDEIVDKDGNVIRDENYDITPYEYKKIFKNPMEPDSEDSGRGRGRRRPRAGSREEAQQEFEDDDPVNEDVDYGEEEEKTSRPRRGRRRASASASNDPLDEGA